jgi:release factor glutamine methyltransferase
MQAASQSSLSPMDIRGALKEAMARLRAAETPSHTLAAELLLMHALGRDRAWIYAHHDELLTSSETEEYFALIARRTAGEPTQYLTGKQEFWGLEFEVTPAVLIPRPETEHVVEVALDRLGARGIKIRFDTGEPSSPVRVADVGTGSGCLAVSLANELPHAEVFATDISEGALEVARRNALRHHVADRLHFVCGNLLDPFQHHWPITDRESRAFDLIVSNPPYIGRNEAAALSREVREHEPHAALFAGATGVEIYDHLVAQAGALLRPGGVLVVEMGHNASEHVRAIFERDLRWSDVAVTLDLAGIERVLAARSA